MRLTHLALAAALSLTFGTYAQAQGTCGELCTSDFWDKATPAAISEAIAVVDVNARGKTGFTPLHLAAARGTPENIITLLKAGADLSARDKNGGFTPLHLAAARGTSENVMALLEAGAKTYVKTEIGISPWDLAQKNGKLKDTKAYWALHDARFK